MDEPARTRLTAQLATHAKKAFIGVLCGLCVYLGPTARAAAPPVRTMYADALAREQAIRVALADPDAPLKLEEVRAVVRAFEAIVAQYPASAYSDNALWQAGRLAIDAFWRFGQGQDKETGVRLLQKLAASYPTSKLAKQVPEELRRPGTPQPPSPTSTSVPAGDLRSRPQPPSPTATSVPTGDLRPRPQPPSPAPSPAPRSTTALATIREIRRVVLPDAVRVTIELDSEVPFHDERIPDPARVFLDLPGTKAATTLVDHTLRFESDADIVRQVRIGRHPNNVTRVVLDAAGVTSYSVYPLYGPYRLVIDCVREQTAPPLAAPTVAPIVSPTVAALLNARRFAIWQRNSPAVTPHHGVILAAARSSVAAPVDPPAPAPATAPALSARPTTEASAEPPARNVAGGLSLARQLGLGVSRIVIDPGHGGHDPGARGKGVTEAELVLDVALRLEKLLEKIPGVEVLLTRRTDDFIALPERTAIANREGADLFLSIHANASTVAQAHGIETYFLNFANNQSAAAVAARENATSVQAMGALPDLVKAIALSNKLDESRDFATQVQRSMVDRLKGSNRLLRDLGVKQAPFVVLIGAVMPSVLAEISFVTNPQEAKLLKGNVYRQRIAEALFNAIRKYQTSLKNTTTVALQ
jgi:N-acetylmuramoyl-L-alanine amidase